MKIFNWVHRRFHQKDDHVGAKSEVVAGNGRDKVSLLDENAGLDSVFDGWKEGILSIGTLGLDHNDPALTIFKDFKPDQDDDDHMYLYDIIPKELFIDDDDDDDELEREMEFPLVLKACKHGFFHDHKDDPCINIDQTYCKPNNNNNNNNNHNDDDDDDDDGLDTTDDQVRKDQKKARERITLADLFWADSENNLLKNNNKKLGDHIHHDHVKMVHNSESNTKHASNDDRAALISKKNPARPIKKINRLVRKMLKKKIHPEVENQKEIARRKTIPIRVSGSVKNEY